MPLDRHYDNPMHDPVNRTLMRLLATRLAAGYAVVGDERRADGWVELAFAMAQPVPAPQDA